MVVMAAGEKDAAMRAVAARRLNFLIVVAMLIKVWKKKVRGLGVNAKWAF